MIQGSFSDKINPKTFEVQQKYRLHQYQHVIVARNRANHDEHVALRLRVGRQGYSQWLNELYVYLLPDLKHTNILPFLASDKTLGTEDERVFNSDTLLRNMPLEPDEIVVKSPVVYQYDAKGNRVIVEEKPKEGEELTPVTFDYWILNDYTGCITLRHYMIMHTLTWPQMIGIALGIANGLNYLHEYADYHYDAATTEKAIDGFIRSTRGALKKISFRDSAGIIHMKPPHKLTIIHRNLSSLNVVLRSDFTPCIWNFGCAHIYHPFQPMNHDHLVDWPIKNIHMTSPYSPPEVLSERAYFTPTNMKSIDMYACGILFWELISRCVLPKLADATPEEERDRSDPDAYYEPYDKEFGHRPRMSSRLLRHAVYRERTRPCIKEGWKVGKKSHLFVQTIRELWDHDYDARLSSATVIERLSKLSLSDRDKRYRYLMDEVSSRSPVQRNKYWTPKDRVFKYGTMWPPKSEATLAPLVLLKRQSTLVCEDLVSDSSAQQLSSSVSSIKESILKV